MYLSIVAVLVTLSDVTLLTTLNDVAVFMSVFFSGIHGVAPRPIHRVIGRRSTHAFRGLVVREILCLAVFDVFAMRSVNSPRLTRYATLGLTHIAHVRGSLPLIAVCGWKKMTKSVNYAGLSIKKKK